MQYFKDKYINDGTENEYSVSNYSVKYFVLGDYIFDEIYNIIIQYFDDFYLRNDEYSLDNYINDYLKDGWYSLDSYINDYVLAEVYVQ